jgi:AcrR family transcriptional regulator
MDPSETDRTDDIDQFKTDQIRARIVAAAAELLAAGGAASVTTRSVAARAGVTAPTIYRVFGDKEGLLESVAQHVLADYVAGKALRARMEDPLEELRAGWRTHLEFGLTHPDVFIMLSGVREDGRSTAALAGRDVLTRRIDRLAAAGRLRVSVSRAVDIVDAAGTGTVLSLLSSSPGQRDAGLGDAMFDAIVRAICGEETVSYESASGAAERAAITLSSHLPSLDGFTPGERALLGELLIRVFRDRVGREPAGAMAAIHDLEN